MSNYIREAFDSDDVVQKNLALRRAYGELEFLRAGGCANDDIERLSAENERIREVLKNIVEYLQFKKRIQILEQGIETLFSQK
jgi:hypothetical protein